MAVSDLEEIEAIKQLKYRYLRAVDLKLWALLESTFAPDAVSAYDGGKYYRARQLADAAREVVGCLEGLAQAAVLIPELPRL